MAGHYSRRKGLANEYKLRDALRDEGFEANRVPSSGAAEGFKGDVRFGRNGREWLAEAKLRGRDTFKRIYNLFNSYQENGIFSVAIPTPEHVWCVAIADTMSKALNGPVYFPPESIYREDNAATKGIKQLMSVKDMLGESDVLVLRNDRKPFLYIRYL